MPNPFDDFTRDLAADPHLTPDAAVVRAWLERKLADDGPGEVISDLVDEFASYAPGGDIDERATVVLNALAADEPQAVVWHTLADALRQLVVRDAERKAESLRWVEEMLTPLRVRLDHFDAIGADRRALAREARL